jgi:hypothetical protein
MEVEQVVEMYPIWGTVIIQLQARMEALQRLYRAVIDPRLFSEH